jgi:hypothetical protein
MKYFTREWAGGQLDDETYEQVLPRYNEYLDTLDQNGAIWRFATTVGLNDAYLDQVKFDRHAQRLKLLLLTGDNQVGYWRSELIYSGVHSVEGEEVLKKALSERPSEIWYDEFAGRLPSMSHAFLMVPNRRGSLDSAGEFRIVFDDFDYIQTFAGERRLHTVKDESDWG